jgi:manganese efflux pump family protein
VLEALRKESEVRNLNGFTNVILGALATSIDALVVGISLSMGQLELHDIVLNTAAVFLVTFLSVLVGMFFGHKVGHKLGKIAELIGGIVLILIGLNILLEFV